MVLDLPSIAERTNVFKNSPKLNQVLKNQGGRNVPKDDEDTDTDTLPTKEFFFWDLTGNVGSGTITYLTLKVPHDYTSITSAQVIVYHQDINKSTVDIDITADYGAVGEAFNNHSESDTASTYNFTANELTAIDISSELTGIAVDDYVKIAVTVNTADLELWIYGIRFRYT